MSYDHTKRVLMQVHVERENQLDKWGEQHHPDGTYWTYVANADIYRKAADKAAESGELTWRHIALEEFYEALAETNNAKLRAELVQAAAVLVAWIEDIDSREA